MTVLLGCYDGEITFLRLDCWKYMQLFSTITSAFIYKYVLYIQYWNEKPSKFSF